MWALLYPLVAWALGGAAARVLTGAGLALVVFTGLNFAVENVLEYGVAMLGAVPQDVLQLALLTGVGEALSMVGSALLTRAAIIAAARSVGIRSV